MQEISKKKYYFIYETTNLLDGMVYRGYHSTNNLDDGYIGSGKYFWSAVNKYGKENFKTEILEFCSCWDEMIEREEFYVDDEFYKLPTNYNLQKGGRIKKEKDYNCYIKANETCHTS